MKLTREVLLNGWLKYHDKTTEDVINELTEEERSSPDWFHKYPVTQEQHDEWYKWALNKCTREFRWKTSFAKKGFALIYLDTAPIIKEL